MIHEGQYGNQVQNAKLSFEFLSKIKPLDAISVTKQNVSSGIQTLLKKPRLHLAF